MILYLIILCLLQLQSASLQCKDHQNNEVPWFFLLKHPILNHNKGDEYSFISSSSLILSKIKGSINDNSPVSNTIRQLNSDKISKLMFNDAVPKVDLNFVPIGESFDKSAHSKGIIAYNEFGGIYIMHSFPEFPSIIKGGKIDEKIKDSQLKYGQNMVCVTLSLIDLKRLIKAVYFSKPKIFYKYNFFLEEAHENYKNNINSGFESVGFYSHQLNFTYLSKNSESNLLIWDDILTFHFQTGLLVESWGRPYSKPKCIQKQTLNIKEISTSTNTWKSTQDHSKWAVGQSSDLLCFGDMNRMDSQLKRGGGALCVKDSNIYLQFLSIIKSIEPCE